MERGHFLGGPPSSTEEGNENRVPSIEYLSQQIRGGCGNTDERFSNVWTTDPISLLFSRRF
jgi:hypothetical protein